MLFKCALSIALTVSWAHGLRLSVGSGGQTIRALLDESTSSLLSKRDDTDPALLYPAHNFSVPVDHFHNDTLYEPHSNATFDLRYWFDATHYRRGGPVIVLQSGETSGVGRLPFLRKGILHQLAVATHGIGVVIEHRYYGTSMPTPDLSTKNLRFLTTAQALADEAYFAQHIKFPGLECYGDLSSNTTAYIGYGGSYAGAFNAFLRVLYPDIFWGTISSSGVTKAIYDYWEYYSPIAEYMPVACSTAQKTFTRMIDNIPLGKNDTSLTHSLKAAFGLPNVTHDDDFANVLSSGISAWQSLNWDPSLSSPSFPRFCDNLTSTSLLYPGTAPLRSSAEDLLTAGNFTPTHDLLTQLLNYIGYMNLTQVSRCAQSNYTQDECFTTRDPTQYEGTSWASQTWRSWAYQYCTEWGYLQTGSGVPADQDPLISRTITVEYTSLVCRYAFNRNTPPDTDRINQYGGYDISYPRLAFVDGQQDPWKPATPHAFAQGAKDRVSTVSEPFILIEGGVHHWDENGLWPNETSANLPPGPVREAQEQELEFVKAWMKEWRKECAEMGRWWW
ncbi:hypothetical protein LTR95_008573 [Oleoguttula sp. CCFEE 5521]